MAEADLIRKHRLAQIRNGGLTAALVLELGNEFLAGKMTRAEFELSLVAAEKLGFTKSAQLAAAHVAEVRAGHGVPVDPIELAEFPIRPAAERSASTMGALSRLDTLGAQALAIQTHAVWADRGAKMGGRRTVELSAAAAGRRWRRVPDANPCAFCAMLATRGFLDDGYVSEKSALTTASGRRYHDFCGCVAVEIVGEWVPNAQEQRYIDLYEQAASPGPNGGLPSEGDVLERMRQHGGGVINDAHMPPVPAAGGAGGGAKPPRSLGLGEPPDSGDKQASTAYWSG